MIQSVANQPQKKHSVAPYIAGLGVSSALGALHGISKEIDSEIGKNWILSRDRKYVIGSEPSSFSAGEQVVERNAHKMVAVAVKMKGLQKILHPFDQWIDKGINKIPSGSHISNFLNESKAPVKHLFKKLHYDMPLVIKGAAFAGGVCLLVEGLCKLVGKINKKTD